MGGTAVARVLMNDACHLGFEERQTDSSSHKLWCFAVGARGSLTWGSTFFAFLDTEILLSEERLRLFRLIIR